MTQYSIDSSSRRSCPVSRWKWNSLSMAEWQCHIAVEHARWGTAVMITRKDNAATIDTAISFHTILNTPSVHDACMSECVCWGPWLLGAQRNPPILIPPEALPKLTPVLRDRGPLSVVLNLLLQHGSSVPKDIQENGPTLSACTTRTYTHVTCALYCQHWQK